MNFRNLPKVELHCHLDGSVPAEMLRKLCEAGNIHIPEDEKQFRKLIQVREDCGSLAEYLRAFDLPLRCLATEEAFFQAAYAVAESAAAENVRYLEVRFAPLLSETEKLPAEAVIEAAAAGLEKASDESGIAASLLLCGMRHFREEDNIRTLELAGRYLGKGVCGIDLAGEEASFPNEQFLTFFRRAAKAEIPMTIHSGECGRKENIRLAVENGAKRIGHGIAMRGDEELMDYLREKRIGVEMCPSSNLQTKAVQSWEEYPFREFSDHGILISVNTDNRTVTGTEVTEELEKLHRYCGLTEGEAVQLMRRAMETAFAEESVKKRIVEEISGWKDRKELS